MNHVYKGINGFNGNSSVHPGTSMYLDLLHLIKILQNETHQDIFVFPISFPKVSPISGHHWVQKFLGHNDLASSRQAFW